MNLEVSLQFCLKKDLCVKIKGNKKVTFILGESETEIDCCVDDERTSSVSMKCGDNTRRFLHVIMVAVIDKEK